MRCLRAATSPMKQSLQTVDCLVDGYRTEMPIIGLRLSLSSSASSALPPLTSSSSKPPVTSNLSILILYHWSSSVVQRAECRPDAGRLWVGLGFIVLTLLPSPPSLSQKPASSWETPRSWSGPQFTAMTDSASCLASTGLRSCRRAARAGGSRSFLSAEPVDVA